jgi:hypothetical protein
MLPSGSKKSALVGFDGSGADAKGLGDLRISAQLYQRQQDSQLSLRQLYTLAMTSGGLGAQAALCPQTGPRSRFGRFRQRRRRVKFTT